MYDPDVDILNDSCHRLNTMYLWDVDFGVKFTLLHFQCKILCNPDVDAIL